MVSATSGWAVGTVTQYTRFAQNRSGIIMQLVNGRWVAFGQVFPGVMFRSISMDSANDGWALGVRQTGGVVALHYTGGQWVSVSVPGQVANSNYVALKVEMVSTTDGWMLIQYTQPRNPRDQASRGVIGILHFHNGNWTLVPIPSMPDTVSFWDMSATGTGGVWFVGTDYARYPNPVTAVIAGYDNGQWSVIRPAPGSADQLTSVSMASATSGWAIGYTTDGGKTNQAPVLLHYNGTAWSSVSFPPGPLEMLTGVYAFPDGDAWLTGIQNAATQPDGYDYAPVLAEHFPGGWQRVPMPYTSINPGPIAEAGSGQFWAAGETSYTYGCAPEVVRDVVFGSVLHYAGGSWSKQDLP
jgi:hypothetical protein